LDNELIMHEKDYLMRLIKSFNDAIVRIVGLLDSEEEYKVKEIISSTKDILGFDEDFEKKKLDDLAEYFSVSSSELEKSDMLSQLLFLESKIILDKELKINNLLKAKFLVELYNRKSNIFSLERQNRIKLIENDLMTLKNEIDSF